MAGVTATPAGGMPNSLPGANVNDLHDPDQVDTFTGTAALNNTWVTVGAAG